MLFRIGILNKFFKNSHKNIGFSLLAFSWNQNRNILEKRILQNTFRCDYSCPLLSGGEHCAKKLSFPLRNLRICKHLLKKSLMENFNFLCSEWLAANKQLWMTTVHITLGILTASPCIARVLAITILRSSFSSIMTIAHIFQNIAYCYIFILMLTIRY